MSAKRATDSSNFWLLAICGMIGTFALGIAVCLVFMLTSPSELERAREERDAAEARATAGDHKIADLSQLCLNFEQQNAELRKANKGLGKSHAELVQLFGRPEMGAFQFEDMPEAKGKAWLGKSETHHIHMMLNAGLDDEIGSVQLVMAVGKDSKPADALRGVELFVLALKEFAPTWGAEATVAWLAAAMRKADNTCTIVSRDAEVRVSLTRDLERGLNYLMIEPK